MYSAVTAAIGALKGPLHGGANEGVIHMLKEIGDEDKVDAWVEEQFAQKKKIMGMGHRVYKTLDPRAPHLRDMAVKLTEQLGEPKWVRMSERIAALVKERRTSTRTSISIRRRFTIRWAADGPVHADLRHRAHGRLDGAHPGAVG